jgi:hypothetical protein
MNRVEMIAATLEHELDKDELRDLITAIDARVGEWSFTRALAKHFELLRAEHTVELAMETRGSGDRKTIGRTLLTAGA